MTAPPIDRGYAWVIVLAMALPQMLYLGLMRSAGLLLVEIMKTFDASSSQAATTFTLFTAANSITSLVVLTVLESRIQKRFLVMTGGLLFGVGVISSFFSSHFLHVVIPYGICAGMGVGFMYGPQVIALRQYFHHRQSLAFGLAVSGASFGGIVIPILFRTLLDEYGFHGGMLLMGGVILQCIIFGALLRPIGSYSAPLRVTNHEIGKLSRTCEPIENKDGHSSDEDHPSLSGEIRVKEESLVDVNAVMDQNMDNEKVSCESTQDIDIEKHLFDENKDIELELNLGMRWTQTEVFTNLEIVASTLSLNMETEAKSCNTNVDKRKLLDLTLLKQPAFLAYLIFATFCNAGPLLTWLFIPPQARDLGFSLHQMDMLISVMGAGDLLGRILLGLVAQTGVIKRHNLLALAMLIVGLTQHVSRFLVVYWSLIVCVSIHSLFAGSFFLLVPLVIADFFGIKVLSNAMGIMLLLQGAVYIPVNVLCAWTRDYTGSYAVCFHLIGSLTMVGAIDLFLIPCCFKLKGEATK